MQKLPFTLFFLRNRKLSDPPPYLTPAAEDTKDLINMAARTGKLQVRAESAAVKKTNKKTGCVIPFFQIMIYQYATP